MALLLTLDSSISDSSDSSDFDLCLDVWAGLLLAVERSVRQIGQTLEATISMSLSDESDESLDGAGAVLCGRFAFSEG